jgi:hypothetical protein
MRPPETSAGRLAAQFVAMHFASMVPEAGNGPETVTGDSRYEPAPGREAGGMGLRVLETIERRQGRDPATVMMGTFLNIQPGGQGIVGMQVTESGAEMGAFLSAYPPGEPPAAGCDSAQVDAGGRGAEGTEKAPWLIIHATPVSCGRALAVGP